MGTTFHGPSPLAAHHPRHPNAGTSDAAIAYLVEDAPDLLPLRAGDVLVVNASRAAVRTPPPRPHSRTTWTSA
ncbi:hypothetical protein GFS60_07863 (plasmid) [Rhodococcus sp. WAY2]|nr:hypothetical protein GFS60_07863 [Rhodococcus sp. WAY2]